MDFFDKLGKKASEAYKMTADKTGKVAKETKIKLKMGELKSKIDDIYGEIGKIVYEKHLREDCGNCKDDVRKKCEQIDEISAEVEKLLQESLKLRNKRQCTNCYEEIERNAKFCHNCGAKQEELKEETEEAEQENVENNSEQEEKYSEEQNLDENEVEVTAEVESSIEKEEANSNTENENLKTTVEIEANPSENMEVTEEEVLLVGNDGESDVTPEKVEEEIDYNTNKNEN